MTPLRAATARVVVLGTGTGVGKTHVSAALVAAAARAGLRVVGLKPVETGVGADADGTDAAVLSRAAGMFHVKHSLYGLPDPVSPHLAARRADVRIDLGALRRWVDAAAESRDLTVVESAGAVFSPLDASATNLDLARALAPATWLLVAADRLGVLHDVRATYLALERLGVPAPPLVLSAPEHADASTGTNADELRALGVAAPLATFPRSPTSSAATLGVARDVLLRLAAPQPPAGA